MAIDIRSEELQTFPEAARSLPHPVHISCLHRWRLAGVHGVKLETCLIGGRRYTSTEALERFVTATTAAAAGERPPSRSPAKREREIRRCAAEMGITFEK